MDGGSSTMLDQQRQRASTVSTFASSTDPSSSGRLRSWSNLSSSADTAGTSLEFYRSGEPGSTSRLQTLDESGLLPPLASPALSDGSDVHLPRPRFIIEGQSHSPSLRISDGESPAASVNETGKAKRRFGLRSLSIDRFSRSSSNKGKGVLMPSASTSASSLQPPLASPYLGMQGGSSSAVNSPAASRASSSSNLAAHAGPRNKLLRRISGLPVGGRSRASSLSVVSHPPSPLHSRAPSPMPPAQPIAATRPSNRHRSASEPMRTLVRPLAEPWAGIDYFDLLLPRELRLLVFSTLIRVCEHDLEVAMAKGEWRGDKAKSQRWAGRGAGIRELVKASRVCKTWHLLAFDSQLWRTFDLPLLGNDVVTTPSMLRMLQSAWSLRRLDLTGMANLTPAGVIALADAVSCFGSMGMAQNSLIELNLTGCRSITANALHYLLLRSPYIKALRLPALKAVTNTLFDVLAHALLDLRLLDITRCVNVDGPALLHLSSRHAGLVDLRISGMRLMDAEVMGAMGLAFPELQHLDMRSCLDLTDAGLRAFVAWPSSRSTAGLRSIRVPPKDEQRRSTRLRHIAVSNCPRLTDAGLEALASTCPELTTLEAGGLGERLQGSGVIALLKTVPALRRLDLDSGSALPDSVLSTLTAYNSALAHIILSSCSAFTERALLHFVRAFPIGGTIELDGTVASESIVREAVVKRRAKEVIAVDCRAVGRSVPNEVSALVRPRQGVRGWSWRQVDYHDDERLGPREMDPSRIVLKTFGTLTQLDAADSARQARRQRMEGGSSTSVAELEVKRPSRWSRNRSASDSNCTIS